MTADPPTHAPPWQVSTWVQALLSSHGRSLSGVQVPFAVAPTSVEHASHGPPLQAVSQQTLSAQKPVTHWFGALQSWPRGRFGVQFPSTLQYDVEGQFISLAHGD